MNLLTDNPVYHGRFAGCKTLDEILSRTTPEDFDGHVDFQEFSPEQKLEWLSQIAQFIHEFKGAASRQAKEPAPDLPPSE